jgi:hypothetical protein
MQMKSLEMTHLSLINFRFRALYLSSGASPYSISFFFLFFFFLYVNKSSLTALPLSLL